MPGKSVKRSNKGKKGKTRKQQLYDMVGCSKKNKKMCKHILGNKSCPNCGPNCHCGPNCKCKHPCPGSCYLNKRIKKQHGGQGCGSCGCPIAPLSTKAMNMFGGNNSILGIGQNGGNFYKPIGTIPGPFIGSKWEPNHLPGQNGIGGDNNYLGRYNTDMSPITYQQTSDADAGYLNSMSLVGGYRYNKKEQSSSSYKKNSLKGGGLIPEDLLNLGRDFNYNLKTAYNAFNGYKPPVNPAPYKDQLTGSGLLKMM